MENNQKEKFERKKKIFVCWRSKTRERRLKKWVVGKWDALSGAMSYQSSMLTDFLIFVVVVDVMSKWSWEFSFSGFNYWIDTFSPRRNVQYWRSNCDKFFLWCVSFFCYVLGHIITLELFLVSERTYACTRSSYVCVGWCLCVFPSFFVCCFVVVVVVVAIRCRCFQTLVRNSIFLQLIVCHWSLSRSQNV